MNTITVDDRQLAVNSMLQILKEEDPEGNHAGLIDPQEAISYAKNHKLDVAFLDVEMPEMNGLDLARVLNKLQPELNIVFVTGHSEYALDAYSVFASAYLVKPADNKDVRRALDNLRHPVHSEKHLLKVRCFGNFEVFSGDRPLQFKRARCKEIFAYLVDSRGAAVSMGEMIGVLWEDSANISSYNGQLRTFISDLKKTLRDAGFEDVLIRDYNSLAIRTDLLDCDFFHFLDGYESTGNEFLGEYMRQYSWAENRIGELLARRNKK